MWLVIYFLLGFAVIAGLIWSGFITLVVLNYANASNARKHIKLVYCRCAEPKARQKLGQTRARYRGQLLFFSAGERDLRIGADLAKYLLRQRRTNSGLLLSQYIACEQCITDLARSYLTHHPNGWEEGLTIPEYEYIYGAAKLG